MRTTIQSILLPVLLLGLLPSITRAQADGIPYGSDVGYADDYATADEALETRVWLDRGDEPVVQRGDEVRVYYRTSQDAFAAIFHIDTDGRVSLVYPQHPDADPYVVGGRDYRLVFPDSPRWRVREDPGVGYFFMVASPTPLDFSLFGWDDDRGWDLRGVGEVVYEDPYVAIDDYVAAILPGWETTPYALDFLEYSVGEDHDYPRFLCYDCHAFRDYAAWDPYARACSSFRVVIWDDPYFLPRFRYAGTRVVFARPFGPRPRYGVTARLVGSSPRPIVRSRPAPPPRAATYKETPRRGALATPTRRPSGVVRSPASSPPRGRGIGASGSRVDERPTLQRRTPSSRRGAGVARPAPRGQPSARSAPSRGNRAGPAPGVRSRPGGAAQVRPRGGSEVRPRGGSAASPRGGSAGRARGGADVRPRGDAGVRPRGGAVARPREGARVRPRAPSPRSEPRARPTRRPGGSTPRAGASPRRPGAGRPDPGARRGGPPSSARGGAAARPPGGASRPGGAAARPPGGVSRPGNAASGARPGSRERRPRRPGG